MGLLIVDENGKILRTTMKTDSKDSGLVLQPLQIASTCMTLLNTEYIAVGSYQTAHKHILHRHSICGHQWFIKPNSILQGSKCPNCYKISQTKTHKQYVEKLNHDYQVLEPGRKDGLLRDDI